MLLLNLPLQFVPVSVNEGCGDVSQLLLCGMPQGSTISLLMFNYLKPLDKVIQHLEVWCHQYTDDTLLHISALNNQMMQCRFYLIAWLVWVLHGKGEDTIQSQQDGVLWVLGSL